MIKLNLEISDPTPRDAVQLRALAAMFVTLADGSRADQTRAALDRVVGMPQAVAASYGAGQNTLDPADNPERGMPSPREAFGSHGSAELDADAAKLEAMAGAGAAGATLADVGLPSPAVAFAGNVGAVPPPPSGPQLSSAATPPTSPPGASVPPPVSPPAATPAPTPGTVSAPAASTGHAPTVDLDSEGVPWDVSIHSSSKAKIANGTWKVKRGTGEAYLLERKAQLKAAVSVGGNAGAPATPPDNASVPPAVAGAPVPPPVPSNAGNAQAVMTPTPQASQPTTPATGASSGTVTLAQVMPRVTAAISSGLLTVDSAAAIVSEISEGKINNVAMLAVAPALLPAFVARLDALGVPA